MRVSIIVPAFNEELLLAASLVEIENAAKTFANRGWEDEGGMIEEKAMEVSGLTSVRNDWLAKRMTDGPGLPDHGKEDRDA